MKSGISSSSVEALRNKGEGIASSLSSYDHSRFLLATRPPRYFLLSFLSLHSLWIQPSSYAFIGFGADSTASSLWIPLIFFHSTAFTTRIEGIYWKLLDTSLNLTTRPPGRFRYPSGFLGWHNEENECQETKYTLPFWFESIKLDQLFKTNSNVGELLIDLKPLILISSMNI